MLSFYIFQIYISVKPKALGYTHFEYAPLPPHVGWNDEGGGEDEIKKRLPHSWLNKSLTAQPFMALMARSA